MAAAESSEDCARRGECPAKRTFWLFKGRHLVSFNR